MSFTVCKQREKVENRLRKMRAGARHLCIFSTKNRNNQDSLFSIHTRRILKKAAQILLTKQLINIALLSFRIQYTYIQAVSQSLVENGTCSWFALVIISAF